MSIQAKLLLWLFWGIMALLWLRYALRTYSIGRVLRYFYSFSNQVKIVQKSKDESLIVMGAQIYLNKNQRSLLTIVKLASSNGEVFPQNLTKNNFLIVEKSNGRKVTQNIETLIRLRHPIRLILLIDKSGSMSDPSGVGKNTKMEIAKRAASYFIDKYTQTGVNHIAVLPFSGDDCTRGDFIKNAQGGIWIDRKSKSDLKNKVARLRQHGATPLWSAVGLAMDEMKKINDRFYKAIIVLSDGVDSGVGLRFEDLLDKARKNHIPIYTMCYGQSTAIRGRQQVGVQADVDTQALISLSISSGAGRENAGSFVGVHPRDWAIKLGGIEEGLDNIYQINWRTEKKLIGSDAEVICRVKYQINGKEYIADTSLALTA